jgi:hypothetical protein
VTNLVFRKHFKARELRNDSSALDEDDIESSTTQDFIMIVDANKIEFPWFSTHGF